MIPRMTGVARPLLLIWMAAIGVVLCAGAAVCCAQAPAVAAQGLQWRSGLSEISENWLEHDGDNLAWAQRDLDESGWKSVDDIEDMGPAETGWRWYRKRIVLGPDHEDMRLLISGGDGTYELYVNGQRVESADLKSAFAVRRPTERVFALTDDRGDFYIALRTRTPPNYTAYQLPLFLSVTIGGPTAIEYERQAVESQRLYGLICSIAINLLLVVAGLGALALFATQRSHRDYLFLGLYLFLAGLSDGLGQCQVSGVVPNAANFLIADPLIYLFSIAQIEFTFSFAGRKVGRGWRAYEAFLLTPLVLIAPAWFGHFPLGAYVLLEAAITLPVALTLPVLLFAWWRQGNREASLLVFPIMLPAATGILQNLGSASIYSGWHRFDFLTYPVQFGPIPVMAYDIGALLFLLAIGVVMFFRFTRVSREQARAAAELDAAREIQRRLVPASLPLLANWRVAAAYLPAQEVGGDFYQVLEQVDGSTLIALGDVSGKGLKAAMTGTLAIGALRTLAAETMGPAELLTRLNRQMMQSQDGGFVTCIAARISAEGELAVANAGHLSPYWNGAEIACEAALPLGIHSAAEYAETAVRTGAGDRITFLSDGVVEARNGSGELLGFERTRELSTRLAAEIAEEARQFGQEDDITVLTLEFAPVASAIASAERRA
ncbi:MAG TPA: PP2C family protein-serine/threonine phosphatase [Terracidiphilus sp.]|nr:PP2C family protein-serine/threonine phosphatase [Terracidiphilus sp.]